MSTLCSVFFTTIRAKEGRVSPAELEEYSKWHSKVGSAFVIAIEKKQSVNTEHIHSILVLRDPKTQPNFRSSIKNLIKKFHTDFMLNVKVGYNNAAVDYVMKDGNIYDSFHLQQIRDLITKEAPQSALARKDVIATSNRIVKYAVTNYSFWSKYLLLYKGLLPSFPFDCDQEEAFNELKTFWLILLGRRSVNSGVNKFVQNNHFLNTLLQEPRLEHYYNFGLCLVQGLQDVAMVDRIRKEALDVVFEN